MNIKEYYQEMKPELDYYLDGLEADKEERRCARMWVKDGHWITENDYESDYSGETDDFITAIRILPTKWFGSCKYTDSFYDPVTQEYIRSLKPTRTELKKLRNHIRSGGRFTLFLDGLGEVDYITFLRDWDLYRAAEFDCYFQEWITKYGAEFLIRKNLDWKFVKFLNSKEDYRKSLEEESLVDELLNMPEDSLQSSEDQSI